MSIAICKTTAAFVSENLTDGWVIKKSKATEKHLIGRVGAHGQEVCVSIVEDSNAPGPEHSFIEVALIQMSAEEHSRGEQLGRIIDTDRFYDLESLKQWLKVGCDCNFNHLLMRRMGW